MLNYLCVEPMTLVWIFVGCVILILFVIILKLVLKLIDHIRGLKNKRKK